jgi:tetratricopeptide (TPR) repeat protein
LGIGLALAIAAAAPAAARVPDTGRSPAAAYVTARAASISGNHAEAAEIYARLAAISADKSVGQRAVSEAIRAGDMQLALRLIGQTGNAASVDSRLLLVANALKRGKSADAVQFLARSGGGANLSFWEPLVRAWEAAERRDSASALSILSQVPRSSAFSPYVDEQSAFILLKLGKPAEAEAYARRAITSAGAREYRVRLALAGGFAAARDRQRALSMLEGVTGDTTLVRRSIESGSIRKMAIDSAPAAFADQLIALAVQMRNSERAPESALNILQVARFADPGSSSAAVLLGTALADDGRLDDALAALGSVAAGDPLKAEALDAQARALVDAKKFDEALSVTRAAAGRQGATGDDFARLGDVYGEMGRQNEAAQAYGQAIVRLANIENSRIWPLLLLKASALEQAGRWPEAKAVLGSAIAIAPNEPLVLNFLGYAKLEHGEDLDAAEALIRKASELAPDDASITDSLGWALYKRGRLEEAIDVLQKAAIGDPAQAEIQEHLGDALYAAGRRFEARFAWQAALATADDEDMARIKSKIEAGLTQATAAP